MTTVEKLLDRKQRLIEQLLDSSSAEERDEIEPRRCGLTGLKGVEGTPSQARVILALNAERIRRSVQEAEPDMSVS